VSRARTSSELPPVIPGLRLLNLLRWQRSPVAVMTEASRRFGNLWTLQFPAVTYVFISEPELLEGVFNAGPTVLFGGEPKRRLAAMMLGPRSLLLVDPPESTALRKLMVPPFQKENVERYHDHVTRICEDEIASWPLNSPLPLLPRMQSITQKVIMRVIYGLGGAAEERLQERLATLHGLRERPWIVIGSQLLTLRGKAPLKAYRQTREALYATILDEIARARTDPELEQRDDVLAILLRARDDDGNPLSDRVMLDQMMTLLVQGHMSTSATIGWALDYLIRHPEMFDRIREEAGAGKDEYLDAVIKETLRIRPPTPFTSRLVKEPYQLGPYLIQPGITLAAGIYSTHHRGDLYPDPEQFRPERFLEGGPAPYSFIPFGGGSRACIGSSFATREAKAILRTIAFRTRLVPADAQPDRIVLRGATLTPERGVMAVVRERLPAAEPLPAEHS
jgi:cytochrome P450